MLKAYFSACGCVPLGCRQCEDLLLENEALKLKLFWRDHGVTQLKQAMARANRLGRRGPNCGCVACAISGRKEACDPVRWRGEPCRFKPYIERLLAECGLAHIPCDFNGIVGHHECDMEGNPVFDIDTHIMTMGQDDWAAFSYGARLWRARMVNDPELLKLVTLFDKLLEGIDD